MIDDETLDLFDAGAWNGPAAGRTASMEDPMAGGGTPTRNRKTLVCEAKKNHQKRGKRERERNEKRRKKNNNNNNRESNQTPHAARRCGRFWLQNAGSRAVIAERSARTFGAVFFYLRSISLFLFSFFWVCVSGVVLSVLTRGFTFGFVIGLWCGF